MNSNGLPTERGSKRRSESGFTLLEMIISVVILTMITGAISAAFVTSLNSSSATNARVHMSDDAQTIAAFLIRDAQAAGGTDPTNPTVGRDPSLGVSLSDPAACPSPGVLKFRFNWRDWVTPTFSHLHVASYFYVVGTQQLQRTTCIDGIQQPTPLTIGNNITSVTPTCNLASQCPGIPDSVSLAITATVTNTPYSYTLQATVRPQDHTFAGGTPASFPSLLALGGCSTGTSSGTTTPGLAVINNSTAGIYGPVVVNTSDTLPSCSALKVQGAQVAYGAPGASLLNNGSCTGNRCPSPGSFLRDASPLADPFSTLPAPGNCSGPAGHTGPNFTPGVFTGAVTVSSSAVFASGNYDVIDVAWQAAHRDEPVSVARRADLRLAATHAVRTSAEIVRSMYDLAGGTAIYDDSPLQRRFRDAHTATAHFQVDGASRELPGRILLGQSVDATTL